jgi:sugar diacid utilization regulator
MIDVTGQAHHVQHEPGVHDRLDVARILVEELLRDARVLAGSEFLERVVTWCLPWDEVAPLPADLAGLAVVAHRDQVEPGSLQTLAQRGVAVLFVHGLPSPDDTLQVDCPVALVQLPAGITFPRLNRIIAELVLNKEAHVLRYGLTVHQSLAELMYRGSGLSALACQLSRLSGCQIAILDPHGRRLAAEYEFTGPAPAPDAVIAELRSAVPLEPIESVTKAPAHGARRVTVEVDGRELTCLVGPIVLGGRHDGWIALVELRAHPTWHELARHEVVVEQATMIVGSEMLRLRSVEIAEERARGDFVHALLHGRLSNPQELIARAAHYDFDISGRYGVIVARQVGVAGNPESQLKMQLLTRAASTLLARNGSPALVTIIGDVLAVVMQTESGTLQRGSDQIAEFARGLHRELSRLDTRSLTVTYGRPMNGATRIVDSYREARVALGVCERLLITDVSGYGELRVFGALLELAGSQHGQVFAREVLEPLRVAARKGGGDLEDAVVAYVESGGNLNAAARKLSLHRNTMLYKLDRASRALGMDLRQAEDQFTFWLAYRIELLADVQSVVAREVSPRS